MKQTRTVKTAMVVLLGFFVLNATAQDPTITDVSVRQRWPWSRLVDIDYVLSCETTNRMDVTLTAYNSATPLTLADESLSGDTRFGISQGAHRIVWDPLKSNYTNDILTRFHVTLTVTNSPLYMIVDLTNLVAGSSAHVEYIYPGDTQLVTVGRWTNVWFGVTNDTQYKTDKLVLRRIPAGTFMAGPEEKTQSRVTLTRDFYVSVFEVTAGQWYRITGSGSLTTSAKGSVTYNDLRGATNDSPRVDWPSTGHSVKPSSFIGQLRDKTGISGFDLPTEAQWEYMSRAGTTTHFNDGIAGSSTNQLNELGWWFHNRLGGSPHVVGLKTANFWGLYDTLGNVFEWCLDWSATPLPAGDDPVGPTSSGSGKRIPPHGGCYYSQVGDCRSSVREVPYLPDHPAGHFGCRVVIQLP